MDIPLVVMFDLTPEDEAYIFTTINRNQTKVDKSVIYTLFGLSTQRSPIKTCHNIAVIMNNSKESPFYRKIKMLGKKKEKTETLSQGAFIDNLLPFIERKSTQDNIFSVFYEDDNDAAIIKILTNYFRAIKYIFSDDWENKSSILTKSTGYGGLCKALPVLYHHGLNEKDLTEAFFVKKFKKVKEYFKENNICLTSLQFGSGEAAQDRLAQKILCGAQLTSNE